MRSGRYLSVFVLFSLLKVEMVMGACTSTISTYPYAESFESGSASWISGGTNSDWILGAPTKVVITGAGDGANCWVTGGLTGSFYSYSQRSWLQSPCFDFTSLRHPEIKFLVFWDTEYQYDGASLQYSLDGGTTWRTLGSNTASACEAQNWYNIGAITNLSGLSSPSCGWSGTVQPASGSCRGGNGSGTWKTASYCLPDLAGEPSVTFRFTFGSGSTCNNFDGFAIDLFQVDDVPAVVTSVSYQCISPRTVLFTDNQLTCRTNRIWDFGDGIIDNNGATTISHTYTSEGSYQVTLSAEHSCRGNEITVVRVNILNYTAAVTPVSCIGSNDGAVQVQIIPTGLTLPQINWSTPGLNGTSVSGLTAGNYVFQISAQAACSLTDTVQLTVSSAALVDPDLGPDRSFCPGANSILKPAGGNYIAYLWQDGSTQSTFDATSTGTYWVRVTNNNGCSGTDSLQLELNCLLDPLFPNSFTPNGDLKNDEFGIFAGQLQVVEWMIFNRWGVVVYYSSDPQSVWKGEHCPEDVYVCLIRYQSSNNEMLEKTGRVNLIR